MTFEAPKLQKHSTFPPTYTNIQAKIISNPHRKFCSQLAHYSLPLIIEKQILKPSTKESISKPPIRTYLLVPFNTNISIYNGNYLPLTPRSLLYCTTRHDTNNTSILVSIPPHRPIRLSRTQHNQHTILKTHSFFLHKQYRVPRRTLSPRSPRYIASCSTTTHHFLSSVVCPPPRIPSKPMAINTREPATDNAATDIRHRPAIAHVNGTAPRRAERQFPSQCSGSAESCA